MDADSKRQRFSSDSCIQEQQESIWKDRGFMHEIYKLYKDQTD